MKMPESAKLFSAEAVCRFMYYAYLQALRDEESKHLKLPKRQLQEHIAYQLVESEQLIPAVKSVFLDAVKNV